LTQAREAGLDLVLVSPTANPPVAKIIDYGRFKYTTEKQQKESKRKQQDVKGIKISPRIAEHDIAFQLKKAIEFLKEGHKVKITCQFRSREITHPELGRQRLDRMADLVKDIAVVERIPTMEGRLMIMVLVPKPATGKKQNAKAEDKQDGSQEVQDNGQREDHPTPVAQ
jgi:translation initiation factor IF-3